jgi:hypothetical protein
MVYGKFGTAIFCLILFVAQIVFCSGCTTSYVRTVSIKNTKPKVKDVKTRFELCLKRCKKTDPPGDTIGHLITKCNSNCYRFLGQ